MNFVSFTFENPFVSFSHTRSIFRHRLKVCLRPNANALVEELPPMPEVPVGVSHIELLRGKVFEFLEACSFADSAMKEIEQDFVSLRQSLPEFSQEDFGTIIVLAKYLACFNGSSGITFADYTEAKEAFFEVEQRTKAYLGHTGKQ